MGMVRVRFHSTSHSQQGLPPSSVSWLDLPGLRIQKDQPGHLNTLALELLKGTSPSIPTESPQQHLLLLFIFIKKYIKKLYTLQPTFRVGFKKAKVL